MRRLNVYPYKRFSDFFEMAEEIVEERFEERFKEKAEQIAELRPHQADKAHGAIFAQSLLLGKDAYAKISTKISAKTNEKVTVIVAIKYLQKLETKRHEATQRTHCSCYRW